jgi:hypothetical protein
MASISPRTVFSFVNLGVLALALGIWFLWPRYADYAIYGFLAWTVVGFVLLFVVWGSRPAAAGTHGAAGAGPSAGADPSRGPSPPAAASAPIGFCVYCGTDLPVGATRCAACGHGVLAL